jgi:hypothetical protein
MQRVKDAEQQFLFPITDVSFEKFHYAISTSIVFPRSTHYLITSWIFNYLIWSNRSSIMFFLYHVPFIGRRRQNLCYPFIRSRITIQDNKTPAYTMQWLGKNNAGASNALLLTQLSKYVCKYNITIHIWKTMMKRYLYKKTSETSITTDFMSNRTITLTNK